MPAAMPEAAWTRLRVEAEGLRADDAFSAAGVGRGAERHEDGAIRGGSICWLDARMPAADEFLGWMDGLRSSLNRDLYLGLESYEAHYAHAPTGASYGTHVDRHHRSNARVVSTVTYLNAAWPADAGGELVLHGVAAVPRLTLSPDGGTLVIFLSEDAPHEAKQATRERWSIAGWFRTRA